MDPNLRWLISQTRMVVKQSIYHLVRYKTKIFVVLYTMCQIKGIHGLCNAKLNTPWKKLLYGKEKFTDIVTRAQICKSKEQLTEQLFDLLSDKT